MKKLVGIGGLAAVAAGVMLLVADLWGLVEFLRNPDTPFSEAAATTSFAVEASMYLIGALLLLVALAGLYARQSSEAGTLGLVGFLAALVGTGMLIGIMWTITFVAPSAAVEAPAFLDNEQVAGPLDAGFMISGLAVALGWALFGVATFRAKVYPRAVAIALTLGALVTFAPFPATTLLLDLALVWMGAITIRSVASEPSVEPMEAQSQA